MGRTLPPHLNPCSSLGFWVCKSLRCCCCGARLSCGLRVRKAGFDGMVVNNSMFCHSPDFIEAMEANNELGKEERDNGERNGESCSSSDFLVSAATRNEDRSHSSSDESFSSRSVEWPAKSEDLEGKPEKQGTSISEAEMMKERFSKLLLGEDMSGSGNGVCPALAISNAITNLCATVFGQVWRLEPLPHEKKLLWRREMRWLLSVSDHVVELIPSSQTFRDGGELEVMTCRPRSDLHAGLPALRKLDNMLLEILGNFDSKEFWYIDQGILAPDADASSSLRRREEKWWLPVPQVPPGGLPVVSRKQLQHKRDSTNQILKAATAINTIALAEMEVPESYLEALPKNGRACLGDLIHRCITSDPFCAQCLLACLDLSSEHRALEAANRIEAAAQSWRRRNVTKPLCSSSRSASRSSWEMVKELMVDTEKWDVLADRAESLLLCLKQRFPGLHQTTLDVSKIQCNKDVGKSILESYSRVLESLAFNVIACIDDLLYVDDVAKHPERVPSGVVSQKKATAPPHSLHVGGTPYETVHATPSFSPCQLHGSFAANGDRSPLVDSSCSLPPCGPCERG